MSQADIKKIITIAVVSFVVIYLSVNWKPMASVVFKS